MSDQPLRPQRQVHLQRDRCPYCHEAVTPADAKQACDDCMAWHHTACWDEHGTCAACGFARSAPTERAEARARRTAETGKDAPVVAERVCRRWTCSKPIHPGQILCRRHRLQDAGVLLLVGPLSAAFGYLLYALAGEQALAPALILGALGLVNVGMGLMRLADTLNAGPEQPPG